MVKCLWLFLFAATAFAQPDSDSEFDDTEDPVERQIPRMSPGDRATRDDLDRRAVEIRSLIANHQFAEATAAINAAMDVAWENEFTNDHEQLEVQLAQLPHLVQLTGELHEEQIAYQNAAAAEQAEYEAFLEEQRRSANRAQLQEKIRAARIAFRASNYAYAIGLFQQAIGLANAVGDPGLIADLNQNLADVQTAQQYELAAQQAAQERERQHLARLRAATGVVALAGAIMFRTRK